MRIEKLNNIENNIKEIKLRLANAISEKGMATSPEDSFLTIFNNILSITTEEDKTDLIEMLSEYNIELNEDSNLEEITIGIKNKLIEMISRKEELLNENELLDEQVLALESQRGEDEIKLEAQKGIIQELYAELDEIDLIADRVLGLIN